MSRGQPSLAAPPSAAARADVSIKAERGDITLSGHLDATTLAGIWKQVVPPLRRSSVRDLHVDARDLAYCDGAGLGLLAEVDAIVRSRGGTTAFEGLSDELTRLFERARSDPAHRTPVPAPLFVENVGAATAGILRDVVAIVAFLGEIVAALGWAVLHLTRVRWRDTLVVAEKAGVNAVPVVCLLGWLVGLIISFQSATPLKRFAAESTIPMMLSISLVRELGPLFTAIILAGRSGSAFAAEIGTMKVTEEINALNTFGLDPTRFLVVPRLLAAIVVTPLLSVLCSLAGLVGGYIVMQMLGFGLPFYINEVRASITYVDFLQGLFKSGVFAFLICAIGCLRGLRTASGPGAVGDSTTRAVVAGIVLVIIADGILGVVFFFVGI